ncbi:MAG: hypothetical protein CO096_12155 [Armatimonadetes bacterium CG_4_9_14_3_um_filter_66_14]|nr:MAG: hypothetical protein CO096_12155 [Armatimonadetes bacterium CG_4_9_14_3_um_filter_66_14]
MTSRDVHVAEAPDLLTRSNALGSFGFSRAENGALVSIVDQQTGHQFVREGSTPRLLCGLRCVGPTTEHSLGWTAARRGASPGIAPKTRRVAHWC